MASLEDVLKILEKQFSLNLQGKIPSDRNINAVGFLPKNPNKDNLSENTLYLVNQNYLSQNNISLNNSVPADAALLILGTELYNPYPDYLYTTALADIVEIFNTAQEILNKSVEIKVKESELFEALYSSKGIRNLMNIAHSYLQNPITLCDTSFSIIESYPYVTDVKNLETRNGKQILRKVPFEDMLNRHILDYLYSSSKALITTFEGYNYKWIFKSIRIKNVVAGYICIRCTVREYTQDDLNFLDIFEKILSIEMQKTEAFFQPTGQRYEYFFTELLEGTLDRSEQIINELKEISGNGTAFFSIVILKSQILLKNQQVRSYFNQIRTILPNSLSVYFQGNLVLLIPLHSKNPEELLNRKRFTSFLKLNNLKAYVSYPFTDLKDVNIYFRQVLSLTHMKNKRSDEILTDPYIFFNDHFLEQILRHHRHKDVLKASVHPDILQIIDYDKNNKTEFTETLKTYLENNRNAQLAAGALHIHKSTFFYRISKMEEMFEINLKDSKKLFAYEYSFQVLDYLS